MTYKITLIDRDGTENTFECEKDSYILEKAEELGYNLPFSCRAGACSTCVGKIVEGTVDQSDQFYLDDDQMAEGLALLCVSYPTSDVRVRTEIVEELF